MSKVTLTLTTLINLLLIISFSSTSIGQELVFKKLDSLDQTNNIVAYKKELHRLNNEFSNSDDTLTKLKINIKLVEYYRLYEFTPDSIVKFYNLGIKQAKYLNKLEEQYNFEFMYGSYLVDVGEFDKALALFNEIRPVIEENEFEFMPHLYDSYAKLFYITNDIEKSFSYLKLEASIFREREDLSNMCAAYNNLGILYSVLPNYDSSIYYHHLAEKVHIKEKDTLNIIRSYSNIANVLQRMNELSQADSLYQLAFELNPKMNNKELLINYVNVLLDRKDYEKAETLLLETLQKNQTKYLEKDIYRQLMEVNKAKGDLSSALQYSEKLRVVTEELLDETKVEAIERLTTEFETEKKEKEIENLHILTENQKLEIAKNRLQTIIVLSVFLLGILIFLLIYRNKVFQTKLNQLTMEQKLLRSKMNPHFIFNSLSNIQSNILQGENQTAVKYLVKFSKLLRYNLEQSTDDAVRFSDEIRSIEDYLDMQKLRLDDNLEYHIELVDEFEMEDIFVPGMMIQPIVENCLEHGLVGIPYPKITITIKDKINYLHINIEDNGIGLEQSKQKSNPNKKSHASEILQRRLKLLSKDLDLKLFYSIKNKLDDHGNIVGSKATLLIPIVHN